MKNVTGHYRENCNRMAPIYDLLTRFLGLFVGGEDKLRRQMIALANLEPGHKVLDVACGTGTLAVVMAEAVGETGETVGIDLSPKMLASAGKKSDRSQLIFRQASAEDIPYPNGYFDRVTITYGLHEMRRAARLNTLREMRRVLKADGRLLIVDMAVPRKPFQRWIFRVLMLMEEETAWDMLRRGLANEVREAGFADIRQGSLDRKWFPVGAHIVAGKG
jgi:ubiquinone/menaquinone biosynthesis C-methylase UbiE